MMHSTSHITPDMMKSVLDGAFSTAVTQPDKHAAKHVREMLVGTHGTYSSVLFDILEMTTNKDRTGLAEMAFLIGMQAGYELGVAHPPRGQGVGGRRGVAKVAEYRAIFGVLVRISGC
jgi:hypothetical protein